MCFFFFKLTYVLINSKEKENIASFVPLEPPFGNDSMSAWERNDGSSNSDEKVKREILRSNLGSV